MDNTKQALLLIANHLLTTENKKADFAAHRPSASYERSGHLWHVMIDGCGKTFDRNISRQDLAERLINWSGPWCSDPQH